MAGRKEALTDQKAYGQDGGADQARRRDRLEGV